MAEPIEVTLLDASSSDKVIRSRDEWQVDDAAFCQTSLVSLRITRSKNNRFFERGRFLCHILVAFTVSLKGYSALSLLTETWADAGLLGDARAAPSTDERHVWQLR